MADIFAHANILIVSTPALSRDIDNMLVSEGISPAKCVSSISEAKHSLINADVDLIILDSQVELTESMKFSMDLVRGKSFSSGIIMLVNSSVYEKTHYQAERLGVVTFKKPLDAHLLIQTIRLLLTFQAKIRKLESQADKLQQKLEGDRLVNRAKIILMDRLKLSEEAAHHYIEKNAMDTCVKKTDIANDIIRKYK